MFKKDINDFISLLMSSPEISGKIKRIFTTIPFNIAFPYCFIEKIEIGSRYYKKSSKSEFSFVLACYFSANDDIGPSNIASEVQSVLDAQSKFIIKKIKISNDNNAKAIVCKLYLYMR
jgi:hypothetical protein